MQPCMAGTFFQHKGLLQSLAAAFCSLTTLRQLETLHDRPNIEASEQAGSGVNEL